MSEIGFLQNGFEERNGTFTDPDFDVNANCSGWNFQSASAPLPLVKIPRDYVHGANCDQPPQNSIRCIKRLLRPQGVLVQYKYQGGAANDANGYALEDHDNPGYTGAGSKYADGCDASLLGAADPRIGLNIVVQQAVLTIGQRNAQHAIDNDDTAGAVAAVAGRVKGAA